MRIRGGTEPISIVQGENDPVVLAERARARFELVAGDHVSIFGIRDREAEAAFRGRVGPACLAADGIGP